MQELGKENGLEPAGKVVTQLGAAFVSRKMLSNRLMTGE